MFGPPLALMHRALRLDARSLWTHLFRALFILLVFGGMWWGHMTSLMFGAPGLRFFEAITWLNFTFITLSGISFFATAISEEKDEAMLGLLKMAGINPLALLLGKSTTRLITALMVLVVQLPFTLLATTLGGVTLHQVLAVYCALAAYMVLVANVGLFCSVYASGSGRAAALTCLLLLFFLLGAPIAQSALAPRTAAQVTWPTVTTTVDPETGETVTEIVRTETTEELPRSRWVKSADVAVSWTVSANVAPRLDEILTTGFGESFFEYALCWQVRSNLLAALGFFLTSWATFGWFTEERRPGRGLGNLLALKGQPPRWLRPRRVWSPPLMWKDFHFITGGRTWMLGKLVGYGLVIAVVAYLLIVEHYRFGGTVRHMQDKIGGWTMGLMLAAGAIELSLYSARLFREEVAGKTLAMLMMLPGSIAGLAWSKTAGCLLGLGPALAWFGVGAALAPGVFVEAVANTVPEPGLWYVIAMFVIFLQTTALLSLVIKWGALPVAFFVIYVGQCCVGPMLIPFMLLVEHPATEGVQRYLMLIPVIVMTAAVSLVLQLFIRLRLETLAAE